MGRIIKWNEKGETADSSASKAAPKIQSMVTELALEMTRRILSAEIDVAPERLERLYGRALSDARGLAGATVAVHPEDRSLVDIDRAASAMGFSVIEDPEVGRGGVRICAPRGEIDASIPALTEAFRDALKGNE